MLKYLLKQFSNSFTNFKPGCHKFSNYDYTSTRYVTVLPVVWCWNCCAVKWQVLAETAHLYSPSRHLQGHWDRWGQSGNLDSQSAGSSKRHHHRLADRHYHLDVDNSRLVTRLHRARTPSHQPVSAVPASSDTHHHYSIPNYHSCMYFTVFL